jgi:F-type H+-transporting ATPase subunit a
MLPRRLFISIIIVLAMAAAPAPAQSTAAPLAAASHDDHSEHAGHEAHHHEPTPEGEVMDSQHEWHFFDNSAFSFKIPLGWFTIFGYPVPTKFMIIELLAAALIAALVIGLARQMQDGNPVKGPLWNAMEAIVLFVRDEVARPYLGGHHHDDEHHGEHPADRFVPYLLTAFLFILFMNVFGLIPFLGSPTGNIYVTGGMALCSFIVMHGVAIAKNGFASYMKSMWLDLDVPPMFGFGTALGYVIKVMIFCLELGGTVIKSFVLAVRLFANVFAGHMVVASILFFIFVARTAHPLIWGTVTMASVLGVIALSLLELFVAFLQAYIFVFLTTLFTGMAAYPEH